MFPDKINLVENPDIRDYIKTIRKNYIPDDRLDNYSAEEISEEIGKSKGWLSQIENGRLKSISKKDLFKIISIIQECCVEDAEFYLNNYLERVAIERQDNEVSESQSQDISQKQQLSAIFFIIRESIYSIYDSLTIDEKNKLLSILDVFNKNINSNFNTTCALLSLPLHAINSNSVNPEETKKFLFDINAAFTNYLASTLNNDIV